MDPIAKALTESGYTWDVQIHDAAEYGAAMTRKRMVIRAVREGPLPDIPDKTPARDWWETIKELVDDAPDSKIGPDEAKRIDRYVEMNKLQRDKPIITMGASASKGVPYAANSGGPSPNLLASPKAVPESSCQMGRLRE